jgi:hypothetical protein
MRRRSGDMTAPDAVPGFARGVFRPAQNPRAARLRVQWSERVLRSRNIHETCTEVRRMPHERLTKAARSTARKSYETCTHACTKIIRKPHGQTNENYTVRPR